MTAAAARSPKRQRLILGAIAAAVLCGAGIAGAIALQDTAAYFKMPADIATSPPAPGETIRLGGLVKPGSVRRSEDGLVLKFVVMDNSAETSVAYRGLVPDLFREGQGVIATGAMTPAGGFEAKQLLAKHDENYMPPEVARSLKEQGHPLPRLPEALQDSYAATAKGPGA